MCNDEPAFVDNDFCFACGGKNPLGLHLRFYRDGDLFCTRITPKPHWQGFQGIVHGGLQSTILDDLMSNHLFRVQRVWVTTGEMSLRFRKPVPINSELLFTSCVESHRGRVWNMVGSCYLAAIPDAPPLTTASGRFIEIPLPAC